MLGGLFLDVAAWDRITGIVTESDFFSRDHRSIFRAIARQVEGGRPVDTVTVAEFLQSHHMLDEVGGLPYLVQVATSVGTSANITRHAEIVRDKAILRQLQVNALEVYDRAREPGAVPLEVAELAEEFQLTVEGVKARLKRTRAQLRRSLEERAEAPV